ncbi:MAG TPA: TIGR03435 family protein [Bryobacteraceae bacterium]|jgi:uncharacterized protein (TIGR03435 family)|nr:TIGR03435 family protein [Bryobacteraceae bacterium]
MWKRPSLAVAVVLVLPAGMLFGQASSPAPAFEVASIKPAPLFNPQLIRSGKLHIRVNIDEARVDIGSLSLKDLLCFAYSVKSYQVSGPDWMDKERFDVLAKLPDGGSKDDVPAMLQALLADRFKLTLHRDSKEQPVYALVLGKNGPKLKESPPDPDAPSDAVPPAGPGFGPPVAFGQVRVKGEGQGLTASAGPVKASMSQDGMRLERSNTTMAMFADMLSRFVDRPVMDMTELKGSYEVALTLSVDDMRNAVRSAGLMMGPGGMPGPAPGGPGGDEGRGAAIAASSDPAPSTIFATVQQLGLKLEPRKLPMTTIVVDHAEKTPTEN